VRKREASGQSYQQFYGRGRPLGRVINSSVIRGEERPLGRVILLLR